MRILEQTPEKTEWFGQDDLTGEWHIKTEWHGAGAVLDRNKSVQGKDAGKTPSGDMHFVGSIPLGLVQKWREEENFDVYDPAQWDRVARKLDDAEYAYLRINTGRLGVRKKMW